MKWKVKCGVGGWIWYMKYWWFGFFGEIFGEVLELNVDISIVKIYK